MIGRLCGQVALRRPSFVLLDVAGVGYEVQVSNQTLATVSEEAGTVVLWIHEQIREDAHELFGFFTEAERALFRLLLKTSGVGPKVALNILSNIAMPRLVMAIEQDDDSVLTRVSGVGRKTAERLMLELRDRWKKHPLEFQQWREVEGRGDFALTGEAGLDVDATPKSTTPKAHFSEDAISALMSLGYKATEAQQAVDKALASLKSTERTGAELNEIDSQTLIREALRQFVQAKTPA